MKQNHSNAKPGKDVSDEDLIHRLPLVAKNAANHKTVVKVGNQTFGDDFIPIIAGPNTIESRSHIIEAAHSVKEAGATILRGGAFKPLTFPYRSDTVFELREAGLEFLAEAASESGLPVVSEVMHVEKVSLVAQYVDILQVGARNMQNYPLLEAVGHQSKPVILKRHFGSSLRDWLGAAEYIVHSGNSQVILCERGVAVPHTHSSTSRYLLDLQVVPAAKELTHLPVICDPSHGTFRREWVAAMSTAAIGAGADGLMIEAHQHPEKAAVDPLQAVSFDALACMIRQCDAIAKVFGRRCLIGVGDAK